MLQLKNKSEHGQIWVLFAIFIPVMLVFLGLAVDFGFAYLTKTTLSRAVDAAALAAMRSISQGHTAATAIAQSEFNVNSQSISSLLASPAVVTVTFPTDSNGDTLINVSATAAINTYFLRVASLLPGVGTSYNTLNVSASAQALRNPLHMSLVLDVSYSMTQNGGETALAPAVEAFIADFDPDNTDTTDYASMVTFGTSAAVKVPMTQPFRTAIDTAVSGINWGVTNWTNSQAGLTDGQSQINSVAVPSGQNVINVVVFFTDGWPNIIQDNLPCTGTSTLTNVMYCGCDTGDSKPQPPGLGLCGSTPVEFFAPSTCSTSNNTCTATTCSATTFPDHLTGTQEELNNVEYCGGLSGGSTQTDAMYRAVQVSTNPTTGLLSQGVYVYSIGMGTAITNQPVAEEFLREVANDPNASTYDHNLPIGEAVFASDSSELTQVFQTIAAQIVLRLSQ